MMPHADGPDGPRTAEAVLAIHRGMCEAVVAADTAGLAALLADDFTLTHMTGYRQSRAEWLAHIDTGEMTYHRMQDIAVDIDDSDVDRPVLTARTRADATIWGAEGEWRLELVSTFARTGDEWVVAQTVASTW